VETSAWVAAKSLHERRIDRNIENGKSGFANRDGVTVIAPVYDYCSPVSNGLAAVKLSKDWGYISALVEASIKPQYARAEDFDEGAARVEKTSSAELYFIDARNVQLHEWIALEALPYSDSYGFPTGSRCMPVVKIQVRGCIDILTVMADGESSHRLSEHTAFTPG